MNAFASPNFWPVRNMLVQVQAKRWLHTVGRREVAELRGSLQPFARGAIVTTSHYSKSAVVEASQAGKNPIVLVDGFEFANIVCGKTGLGGWRSALFRDPAFEMNADRVWCGVLL